MFNDMNYLLRKCLLIAVTLIGGFTLGGMFWPHERPADVSSTEQLWSCPMHPQITASEPGNCSICGMSLASRAQSSASHPQRLEATEELLALSKISTSVVEKGPLSPSIYLQGRVEVQPAQLHLLSTTYAARVEALYLQTEGTYVRKGQPIARLYAAELEAAKAAFLAAERSDQQAWRLSTRKQLKDWGMSNDQLKALSTRRLTSPYLELSAPRSGHLLRILCRNGETLKPGAPLYELADLSSLWLHLEATPSDLPWLKKGLEIPFRRAGDNYASFTAQLYEISATTSPSTGNLTLRALVKDPSSALRQVCM